jgi:ribonuclease HI
VARWIEEKDDSKKNMDLWTEIYKLIQFHKVTFVWVKGHNNNEFNELADLYAQHAAECLELTEDEKL